MAGSYRHVRGGWSLIEHMGDAHEAVVELMWLVQSQIGTDRAQQLLDDLFYPMERGERPNDDALLDVKRMMQA